MIAKKVTPPGSEKPESEMTTNWIILQIRPGGQ